MEIHTIYIHELGKNQREKRKKEYVYHPYHHICDDRTKEKEKEWRRRRISHILITSNIRELLKRYFYFIRMNNNYREFIHTLQIKTNEGSGIFHFRRKFFSSMTNFAEIIYDREVIRI
jgi:hypothetical protein